jgi:hypothetical protein
LLHDKNVTATSAKKEEHGAYTIKNSMEFYPSQILSTRSIAPWQKNY